MKSKIHLISVLLPFVVYAAEGRTPTSQGSYAWTDVAFCPSTNSFLSGMSLIYKKSDVAARKRRSSPDPLIAWGVNVTCSFVNSEHVDLSSPVFPPANGNFTEEKYAPAPSRTCGPPADLGARMYGFIVGVEKSFYSKVKRVAKMNTYCNYEDHVTREATLGPNSGARDVRWEPQSFCPWGKYACGVKLRYDSVTRELVDIKTECCKFLKEHLGWKNYRGETGGRVVSSTPPVDVAARDRKVPDLHFASQLDDPYYFKWEFCPVGAYVTGLQGQLARRLFRLSCSDVSEPAPRVTTFIGTSLSASQWEEEEELSGHTECEGGVVIGIQVLYGTNPREIQGLRLICSYTTEGPDQLTYVKVLFPASEESESIWGDAQMCRRGEAVCGWKPREVIDKFGFPIGTDHVKVKCCHVPSMSEICAPHDAFELLLECDAREAMAQTTCQYTLTEGFTVSTTSSEHHSRSNNLRNALNEEWSIAEAATLRQSIDHGTSTSAGGSHGESETNTKTNSASFSNATTDGRSSSSSVGLTNSSSSSDNKAHTKTHNVNEAFDQNRADSKSKSSTDTLGSSGIWANTQTSGRSENFLNTRSSGRGFSDSTTDVVGSSTGSLASTVASRGRSGSVGKTRGGSSSDSSTGEASRSEGRSSSHTAGGSLSLEVEKSAEVPFLAKVNIKASMQAHYSYNTGSSSDSTQRYSRTRSQETSRSETAQVTTDESNSRTAQETSESSHSNTKGRTSDVNEQESEASGGDLSNTVSVASTREENSAATQGVGSESSASKTNRTEEGRSLQESTQLTNENGQSSVRQKGEELSRNNELRLAREDSDMASIARTKEATFSQTDTSSRSEGREGSKTRSGGGGSQREKQFTTGFDWTKTSESTWRRERSYQVTMTVPPGYRSRLFQVVGYCAHFQVRTNNYKRMDEVADWVKKEKERAGPAAETLQQEPS